MIAETTTHDKTFSQNGAKSIAKKVSRRNLSPNPLFERIDNPNFTQLPNDFRDHVLAQIKDLKELKVVLAVIGKTHGHHKDSDEISLSQFVRITGMHKELVLQGIELAIRHGWIARVGTGRRKVSIYTTRWKLYVEEPKRKLTGYEITIVDGRVHARPLFDKEKPNAERWRYANARKWFPDMSKQVRLYFLLDEDEVNNLGSEHNRNALKNAIDDCY